MWQVAFDTELWSSLWYLHLIAESVKLCSFDVWELLGKFWRVWADIVQKEYDIPFCWASFRLVLVRTSSMIQSNLQTEDTLGPWPLSSLRRLSSFQWLSNIYLVSPPSMIWTSSIDLILHYTWIKVDFVMILIIVTRVVSNGQGI